MFCCREPPLQQQLGEWMKSILDIIKLVEPSKRLGWVWISVVLESAPPLRRLGLVRKSVALLSQTDVIVGDIIATKWWGSASCHPRRCNWLSLHKNAYYWSHWCQLTLLTRTCDTLCGVVIYSINIICTPDSPCPDSPWQPLTAPVQPLSSTVQLH